MLVVVLVVVAVVLVAMLGAAFAATRRSVAVAAAALASEVPDDETIVARASANRLAGPQRGLGALVVTDRAVRFRRARSSETLVVERSAINAAWAAGGALEITWSGGVAGWQVADPAALAALLRPDESR